MTVFLVSLRADYDADRASRLATSQPVEGTVCRYCGKYRMILPGTKLDGHAHCVVSDAFKLRLLEVSAVRPPPSWQEVSVALGVDQVNVRAWYRRAQSIAAGTR